MFKKLIMIMTAAVLMLGLASCGDNGSSSEAATQEPDIGGDYYIDLTDLGMKLTIYLRIDKDSNFKFSKTTAFDTSKSEGRIEKNGGEYLMIYSSVNGEAKSASDGLQSKFVKLEDGSLDFSSSERVYYGTVGITPTSDEHPGVKLTAHPITADYKPDETKSTFRTGTYSTSAEGVSLYIGFFEDGSYLLTSYSGSEYFSEVGRYGVSGMQLALTPQGGSRASCEMISRDELKLNVPTKNGGERQDITFKLSNDIGTPTDFTFEDGSASMKLYPDGSVEVTANGFTEKGLIAADSASGSFKFYPDHPTENKRGLEQVANVPAGKLTADGNGLLTFSEFRVRTSEELTRTKITFIQEEK